MVDINVHAYATDAVERERIPLLIGALAVGLSWSANAVLSHLNLTPPWWFEAPTPMGFFGVLYWCYNNAVWRLRAGEPFGFSKLPNLNGTWVVLIRSTYDVETQTSIVVHIQQTWSKIGLELEGRYSKSCSTMAAVNVEGSDRPSVSYAYLNEPKMLAESSMHSHRGFAQLTLVGNGKALEGDYFTGRDRTTIGTMTLKLVSRQILDRDKTLAMDPVPSTGIVRQGAAGERE